MTDLFLSAGVFALGIFAETFITWSEPILTKRPIALWLNNAFVIGLLILLIAIFVRVGLAAGLAALVLGLVAWLGASVIVNRRRMRRIFGEAGRRRRNT